MINTKIFAAIIVAVLAGGAAYYLRQTDNPPSPPFSGRESDSSPDKGRLEGVEGKISEPGFYKDGQYGFSLSYPKSFNVSDFDDSGGKMILFKNAASDNGFQIFITAFDEPGVITKERILKDIPDMTISGDEYIDIGGEHALSFIGQDDLGGKMREIWLVHSGYLYRVKAYESFEEEMLKIINTIKFPISK